MHGWCMASVHGWCMGRCMVLVGWEGRGLFVLACDVIIGGLLPENVFWILFWFDYSRKSLLQFTLKVSYGKYISLHIAPYLVKVEGNPVHNQASLVEGFVELECKY